MRPSEIKRLYDLYPSVYRAPGGGEITIEDIAGEEEK